MKIAHRIAGVSGGSIESCYYLAHRYDEAQGVVPEGMDSWVLSAGPAGQQVSTARPGWMNGLWWSPGGNVYATVEAGKIYMLGAGQSDWLSATRGGSLLGVWGLDDQNVFAWGKDRGHEMMHVWNGQRWNRVVAPGEILAVQGVAADQIFAVGAQGLCARWDGQDFHMEEVPTEAALWSVTASPDGRVWACGPRTAILERTDEGWVERATSLVPPLAVAYWNEQVWVACGEFGLFVLEEEGLRQVHKDLHPVGFDARGNLVMFGEDALAETADGESFQRLGLADFRGLSVDKETGWTPVVEEPDVQDDDDPDFEGDFDDDDDDEDEED